MINLNYALSAFMVLVSLAAPHVLQAAEIRVFCDGPLQPAMEGLRDVFSRDTGHRVEIVYAPSPVLHKRVMAGESVDVLITQPARLEELVKDGRASAADQAVVGRIGIGFAVRAGVATPDISNAEALKRTVLDAESLAYTNLATGMYFGKLLERLGIAAEVKDKTSLYPSGAAVLDHVLKRKGNDVGVGAVTQIIAYRDKGLKLVGPLPAELQSYTVFTAAVMAGAKSPDAAKEFTRFLTSTAAKAALAATGVE